MVNNHFNSSLQGLFFKNPFFQEIFFLQELAFSQPLFPQVTQNYKMGE